MVDQWEPGTQYDYGAVVFYEGHKYKIIQPHRSQGDWAPPLTPALWGRLEDSDDHGSGNHGGGHHGGHQQQQPFNAGANYGEPQQGYPDDKRQDEQQQEQHEEKKNWVGEHKKELEIGAGLLAGAAALAGGAFAYKKHKEHEREEGEYERRRDD